MHLKSEERVSLTVPLKYIHLQPALKVERGEIVAQWWRVCLAYSRIWVFCLFVFCFSSHEEKKKKTEKNQMNAQTWENVRDPSSIYSFVYLLIYYFEDIAWYKQALWLREASSLANS